MGNEICNICSIKEQNPLQEEVCLSQSSIKQENSKPVDTSTNRSSLLPLTETRHSSLNWNISTVKTLSFKEEALWHFMGEIQNGKRQGKGKILFPDGGYYEGEFKDDNYHGKGTLLVKEYKYTGEFEEGKKKGKGKIEYFNPSKKIYEGSFIDDVQCGYGKELSEDGTYYEGFFANGKKDNKGKLILPNGNVYTGEFNDDVIEGNGEFKWSALKYYKGEWKDNCIDGFGVFTEDDKEYIGYFTKNVKNGIGANYYIDNYIFMVAKWKNDNLCDGLSIVIDKDNKESLVLIKNKKSEEVL